MQRDDGGVGGGLGWQKKELKEKKKGHPQVTLQRPPTNNNTHAHSSRFPSLPSEGPRCSPKGKSTPLLEEAGWAETTSKPLALWISWSLQIKRNKVLLHQVEKQVKMLRFMKYEH